MSELATYRSDFQVDVSNWGWIDEEIEIERARRPKSISPLLPPGGFSPATSYLGGPAYIDRYGTVPGPTSWDLVNAYKSLLYSCTSFNEKAVCRVRLRLYADQSLGKGVIRSECDPAPLTRSMRVRMGSDPALGYCRVSPSTVDQVYEIRNSPFLDLIDNPDPYGYFDRLKLLSLICRYCDVVGSAYFVPRGGPAPMVPAYFWPLYSQYVLPVRDVGTPLIGYYSYFADRLPFDAVVRFQLNDSLRDPYGSGYSPCYAAIQYARLEDAYVTIQEQLLSAGPRPNLLVSPKDALQPMGEAERRRLEQDLNRKLAKGNAGKAWVTNGSLDVSVISMPPTDMAGKELSEYDIKNTCACFGIPPTVFTTDTNLANLQAAKEYHALNAVEPRCHMIASRLTRFARQFDPRLYFAFDPALREDEEQRARIVDMRVKNGTLTINEATEEDKTPPKSYGDEPWMSGGVLQPSMIQANQQMALTQQAASVEQQQIQTDYQFGPDAEEGGGEGEQQQESGDEQQDFGAEEQARSIAMSMMIDRELAGLEEDIARAAKGNPYHEAHGPKGGQFTSGPSTGGPAVKQGRPPAKPGEKPTHKVNAHHDDKGTFKPSVLPKADVGAARKRDDEKEAAKADAKALKSQAVSGKIDKSEKEEKVKPIYGEMAVARREGKGKDAKLVMADGSAPPGHVTPAMVPPDWSDVRVSVDPKAEVLVKARDSKGRTKMVTSESYDARSAVVKFARVSEMIAKHDRISKEIQEARKEPETKEEADVAWLMQVQGTRPGKDADTKAKVKAYGATTLEARHVVETPEGVRLRFIGKEGVSHDHLIRDKGLADMMVERKNAAKEPGDKLFKTDYVKVNKFTSSLDGGKFTPKDFRTSMATRMATDAVKADPLPSKDPKEHQARVKRIAEHVSGVLGNKPAQALQSYIHPAVFASWSP